MKVLQCLGKIVQLALSKKRVWGLSGNKFVGTMFPSCDIEIPFLFSSTKRYTVLYNPSRKRAPRRSHYMSPCLFIHAGYIFPYFENPLLTFLLSSSLPSLNGESLARSRNFNSQTQCRGNDTPKRCAFSPQWPTIFGTAVMQSYAIRNNSLQL